MPEYVNIVNERDEVIGQKNRDHITPGDRHRAAELWICNGRGELLLAQRSLEKRYGAGQWGPSTAGTVRSNETYEQNIRREAAEELGLAELALVTGPKELRERSHKYFVQHFFAVIEQPLNYFTLDPGEVAGVAWYNRESLRAELAESPQKFVNFLPTTFERLDPLFPWL